MSEQAVVTEDVVLISEACTALNTTPQVINKYIRDGKLDFYHLEGDSKRRVKISEVAALLSTTGQRSGGKKSVVNRMAEDKIGEGTILHCIVQTKRKVAYIDKFDGITEVVKLSKAEEDNWGGTYVMAGNLLAEIESDNWQIINNKDLLRALIGSFKAIGEDTVVALLEMAQYAASTVYNDAMQAKLDELEGPVAPAA